MAILPEPLQALAAELKRLPGIGPRSAERLALHLAQTDPSVADRLAKTVVQCRARIAQCPRCGGLTEATPCSICANPARDAGVICVVERAVDIITIEKCGAHRGLYHVLGGKLSPVNGVGPEDLRIAGLEKRVRGEDIYEVILALGADVEGDATSHYLARRLQGKGIKISRIAHGLPAGSGLEFADELTLSHALEGRRELGASRPGGVH